MEGRCKTHPGRLACFSNCTSCEVTTYWDMAASLVVQNAIPAAMFNAANTEHIALYAKLRPFLKEIRETTRYSDYLQNVEDVVRKSTRSRDDQAADDDRCTV